MVVPLAAARQNLRHVDGAIAAYQHQRIPGRFAPANQQADHQGRRAMGRVAKPLPASRWKIQVNHVGMGVSGRLENQHGPH